MPKFRNIYVAATSQHVGKTTSTLGLVSAFMSRGFKVGYCKPVGQKFLNVQNLRVDKDTILFADLIGFDIVPEIHSPVILGPGATERYLDNPHRVNLEAWLKNAEEALSIENDIVIYEGTGHPGVGSVAGVSNAHVAKIMNAGVIMVVEGGIGSTIDMLNMTTALFREEGVPIIGVIINKVIPEKIEKIRHYVGKWLDRQGLPLLGLIPYEKTLAYPLIKSVADAVRGVVTYNADQIDNKVENIIAGSLIELDELKSSHDLLLVVATKSINEAIRKIEFIAKNHSIENCPLSGIVATGEGTMDTHTIRYIEKHKLPLIRTDLDTYGAVLHISRIEVKINRSTPWKIRMAIDLIDKNIDLNPVIGSSRL
ncbi:MAG: AAA family ATPase [Saprospiraceae bacterium]|nr:MAG: DRTGG domain-containing protein [Bacteroidetes bacterium OLB9]MCO6463217.1 AAA family ATPase [Saprospiraceae bacterium]MCZ2339418.1 AAA family ATPase [Chitinophagales bacterium]